MFAIRKVKRIAVFIALILVISLQTRASGLSLFSNDRKKAKDLVDFKFNMSYIHYSDKQSYINYVDNTKGALSEVAPGYFKLSSTGSLIISSTIDKNFIDEMHKRGIKVVPYLSNDWDRTSGRLALSKRHTLSTDIAEAVQKYNLDGVNVDLENLTEDDRERYVDFIRLLRKKLTWDKTIAVAVAANPKGLTTGWHGSYDYEELAKYCDYLMIMTYDEHYSGGSAGPVASINFVEKSIQYALERVPKEKIVLGIPFYGRIWRSGGGLSGQGISLKVAENLIANYGGNVMFSNVYLSPKATITIKTGSKKPVVNGKTLSAGTYTIWYENEQSIKYKLNLVKKYDLKGTGSWSLGQEPSNVWDYYNLWLNGQYYEDCEGHWAQKYIIFALNNGWLEPEDKSEFAPDKPVTRAEAVVAIIRALQLEDDKQAALGDNTKFSDISGHWAEKEILSALNHRIVAGNGGGAFLPDKPVTREEIAVMMDRAISSGRVLAVNQSRGEYLASSLDEAASVSYNDVNLELCAWSYSSIMRMAQIGLFANISDGDRFNPKKEISKAEMAALLYNIYRSN